MQFRGAVGLGVMAGMLLLGGALWCAVVWWCPEWLGIQDGSERQITWLRVSLSVLAVLLSVPVCFWLFSQRLASSAYRQAGGESGISPDRSSSSGVPNADAFLSVEAIKTHLRDQYGLLWRRKVRVLWIVGDAEQVAAIVPGLVEQRWLEGQGTLLLWGGSAASDLPAGGVESLLRLRRWRPLDGIVWVLTVAQRDDEKLMVAGTRQLRNLAGALRWQAPLHLWQVCASEWPQTGRPVEPVGCLFPPQVPSANIGTSLQRLLRPLQAQGVAHVETTMSHDFLWRLSRDLQVEGITRWQQALAPLLGTFARFTPLRGLWFSLASEADSTRVLPHIMQVDKAWSGVLGDAKVRGRALGWHPARVTRLAIFTMAALWGAGMLLSFVSNRAQIAQVQSVLASVQQPNGGDEQLLALNELMHELGRLDYRAEHGVTWYRRFGLDQNQALQDALWPRYVGANHRLIREPAVANLSARLSRWARSPADSAERTQGAAAAYEQLKAYLMMARPEKADAAFLAKALANAEPQRGGVTPGLWKKLAPDLLQFYGEQLARHPDWRIEADPALIAQARRALLGQLGQSNAESSLYQKVLDAAANHSPALSLHDMVGYTDALALFSSNAEVPGVFTRQAWEGQIRQAIDDIAEARREEIDWVLSDSPTDIAAELSPEVLKQRLTARYFDDYGSAWLSFLNSLRWQPVRHLAEVIDQLTLMSDARQSPLIALMNTLAWQGQAGTRGQALTESLMQSAQKLIGQEQQDVIDQLVPGVRGPLESTFGPLLSLVGKGPLNAPAEDALTLQAYLSRVTRVRLKLQQISNSADPQEMTQTLAQAVFQDKGIDLTDTQTYGRLIAASLGAEWGGIGQTLFVQPLDQAWKKVLQPAAQNLNKHWQRAVVSHWDSAFAGRYPFAATGSDASLPMLGQMIRADSGRIEQFLQRELSGVVRKEGSQWVQDPRQSQGLRLNPQFLVAINQLTHLADVLYTDGGMGLGFELRGKAARGVVQTTFILNGETHHYFNQKEKWQRFAWPGSSSHPGASLTWTGLHTGERLFGDFQGVWGLIRLLEQANATLLDDSESRYRLIVKAPDGSELTWHLRTEVGAGPLALLKLRGFTLPKDIFVPEGKPEKSYALNGSFQ